MSKEKRSVSPSSSDLDQVVSEIKAIPYGTHSDKSQDQVSSFQHFLDSFKRQESNGTAGEQLQKTLSLRHIALVALFTGLGTGLLVGSGGSLERGGPLALVIAYLIVGSMLYATLQAGGEMAVAYSGLSGGFNSYPRKFLDESIGFAVAWNYCIQWVSVISLELVTASITIKYWTDLNSDIFVAILFVVIIFVNFFGAKGYGAAEMAFGLSKLLMLTGFVILGIILNVGGAGKDKEYIGGRYWNNPGSLSHGFKGICACFVGAAFALGGTEFIVLTCAEQRNPKRAIKGSVKLVFWRIAFFYLTTLTIVGLLVPYTSDELMGSSGGGSHASPFVIAIASHGIKAVPSIINSVILLSVLSVANSAVYASSRTLQSLAEQGFAPSYFNYIDRNGRPFRALVVCSIFGLFCFIAAYNKEDTVFNWLLSISGLSTIFTWSSICASHIRFRSALKANGRSPEELGFRAATGVWGSYYAIFINALIIIAEFWVSLFPVGSSKADANNFFQNYLGVIVLIVFYIGHKLYRRSFRLLIKVENIDIHADRKLFDQEILKLEEEAERESYRNSPFYKKALKVIFF